jgi:hypothetical protein
MEIEKKIKLIKEKNKSERMNQLRGIYKIEQFSCPDIEYLQLLINELNENDLEDWASLLSAYWFGIDIEKIQTDMIIHVCSEIEDFLEIINDYPAIRYRISIDSVVVYESLDSGTNNSFQE